jgi:hypothetical protein
MQEQPQPYVSAAAVQPTEPAEKASPETLVLLKGYHQQFSKQALSGRNRKERIEKLMVRYSAARWSPEKRAKMIRRHQDAIAQMEQATKLLDQVNVRLQQMGHDPEVVV